MDNPIAKRILIVGTIFVLIIVLAVACNEILDDDDDPTVSNPEEPFFTYGENVITRGELYDRMKAADGTIQLIDYIDQKLLEDEIEAIEDEDVEEEIKWLTYDTNDPDEIDRLSEREKEEMEQEFADLVLMSGFDPDDEDSVDRYVRIQLAKESYTKSQFQNDDEDEPFYVSDEDLERYYEDYKQGDLSAISLRFYNEEEYENVLNHFNLVDDYEDGFGLYTGDEDIDDVEEFDDEDIEALDEEETLEYYIRIHNYLYAYRDTVDEDLDLESLIELDYEYFQYNQGDLQEKAATRDEPFFAELSETLYHDLDVGEFTSESVAYEFEPETDPQDDPWQQPPEEEEDDFDDVFLFYVLDREEVTDFEDLASGTKAVLMDEYTEDLVGETQIVQAFEQLHEENGLTIYDQGLAMFYAEQFQTQRDLYSEDFDGENIATLDDFDVHIDEYFDYMADRVGAIYGSDLLKEKILLESEYFIEHFGVHQEAIYGQRTLFERLRDAVTDEDRAKNRDLVQGWHEQLRDMREQVEEMGFEWELYLELQMSVTSNRAFINRQVANYLQGDYIMDRVDFDNEVLPYLEDAYENYLDMENTGVVFYLDREDELIEEDIDEYLETLSSDEQDAFENLLEDLEDTFTEAYEALDEDEDETLEDLIEEYETALRGTDEDDDDYSRWGVFKNVGLRIDTDERGRITYSDIREEDEELRNGLRTVYEALLESDDDVLISESLTKTETAFHLFQAERTDDTERPSAAFDNEDNLYDEGFENSDDFPTIEQLSLYSQYLIEESRETPAETNVPEEVEDALDALYLETHSSFFGQANATIVVINELLEGDFEASENEEHHRHMLDTVSDIFYRMQFPPIEDD